MTRRRLSLKSVDDLIAAGVLAPERREEAALVAERYAVALTPAIADLVESDDPHDPIARQFLPDKRELERDLSELADPIGDGAHSVVKGVVHRYPDRVLLKVVGVCPVYCRFCFRREMVGPGTGTNLTADEIASALAYVAARPGVWEVIVTGGDPFVLSPRRVAELTGALAFIPHVKVLRWHTRVPVVAPERVTDELITALKSRGRAVYVGLHVNHARELTPAARAACARLVEGGIPLLSQTVLLRGINDDPDTMEALLRALVETRVKPYYLHHPDLAPGTRHFRTSIADGQALMRALRERLSGVALPTYVLDIPGGYGKVPISPGYIEFGEAGDHIVWDAVGTARRYLESCPGSDLE